MLRHLVIGPGAFRLLLAVLVFVSHVSRFSVGRPAVIVFFMLSGYWVTRLYTERAMTVPAFLRDRFLRVWPLLAVVAAAVVAIDVLPDGSHSGSLRSTLALLGLATRGGDVIGVAWSLDVEAQFYLLLPSLVALGAAVDRRWRVPACVAAVVVLTVIGIRLRELGIPSVLLYAPAFAAGAAIWLGRWSPGGRWALASVAVFVAAMAGAAMLPGMAWLVAGRASGWWHDVPILAVCLALTPFVAWNVHQPSPEIDRHLGNLSFPFYLVHFPIVAAMQDATASPAADKLAALLLSTAATLALYRVVDRPMERFRRKRARVAAAG